MKRHPDDLPYRRVLPVTPNNRLGERLRSIREARGMLQKGAAEAAGITLQYLSRIEGGQQLPSDELLRRLAAVYSTRLKPLRLLAIHPDTVPMLDVETILADDRLLARFIGRPVSPAVLTWARESLAVLSKTLRDHSQRLLSDSSPPDDPDVRPKDGSDDSRR